MGHKTSDITPWFDARSYTPIYKGWYEVDTEEWQDELNGQLRLYWDGKCWYKSEEEAAGDGANIMLGFYAGDMWRGLKEPAEMYKNVSWYAKFEPRNLPSVIDIDKLDGWNLDAIVAMLEGEDIIVKGKEVRQAQGLWPYEFTYHKDWIATGTIQKREKISVGPVLSTGVWYGEWRAVSLSWPDRVHSEAKGDDPRVAVLRCYVKAMQYLDSDQRKVLK